MTKSTDFSLEVAMSQQMWVPKKAFLCAGTGRSSDQLQAFELALLGCGPVAHNLVAFSSIIPADCEFVSPDQGFKLLIPGQITFCVMARQETNKKGEIASGAIGLARAKNPNSDPDQFGYISEFHSKSADKKRAESEAQRLAVEMLARRMDKKTDQLDLELRTSIAASIKNTSDNNWVCAIALCIVIL